MRDSVRRYSEVVAQKKRLKSQETLRVFIKISNR